MIKHCLGCGTVLQSEDKNKPGYISDINKDYCMRCFRLTHYNEKTVTIVHNDIKEINLVIETKDYKTEEDIPFDQKYKIKCAERFFEQLKEDGYDVKFRLQINNTQISTLIRNL